MRVLQTLALPLGHDAIEKTRAGDEIRTHDLLLGKETYYHCTTPAFSGSTFSRECRDTESNCGHRDFQSRALPTELSRPDGLSLSVRDFTLGYRDCQARFVYRAERSETETKRLLTSTCFRTTMPAYTKPYVIGVKDINGRGNLPYYLLSCRLLRANALTMREDNYV